MSGYGSTDWVQAVEIPRLEAEIHRAEFMVISRVATAVSSDEDASSFVNGIEFEQNTGEFQLEADVGGIRNISGRTLLVNDGLVSMHLVSTNVSNKLVKMFSERGTDKVVWTKNADSGRQTSISSNTEDYGSKSSEAFEWLDNEVIRFKIFTDGGNVDLSPVSFLADGDTVTGPSFRWKLKEALPPHGV